MNITVFGASGKVGRLVVAELLKRGHKVTAFVHSNAPFEESKQLKIVRGDVHVETDVESALRSADAVVSTLGSWGTKEKDILSSAMKCIIPVMKDWKIKRIVSLTGSGIILPSDKNNLLQSLAYAGMNLVAHKIVKDGRTHIMLLQGSGLEWTVLRSPVMDNERTPAYLLDDTPPKPWDKISRNAVARAMADCAESGMFIGRAPFIH